MAEGTPALPIMTGLSWISDPASCNSVNPWLRGGLVLLFPPLPPFENAWPDTGVGWDRLDEPKVPRNKGRRKGTQASDTATPISMVENRKASIPVPVGLVLSRLGRRVCR